jgi:hypothetical protein
MFLHITAVTYLDDYRIKLIFNDGLTGVAYLCLADFFYCLTYLKKPYQEQHHGTTHRT